MGSATNDGEDFILDHFLGTTQYAFETQLYVALMTGDTTSDSTVGTEVSAGNYARKAVNFNAASGGSTSNSNAPSWTANANYGTVTHINLYTAASGGDRLFWAALNTERTINDGDTLTIEAGNLTVTLT